MEDLTEGVFDRAMIVGKGSLFLGRMTNLFDGVSVILERNTGIKEESTISEDAVKKMIAETMRGFAKQFLEEQE
jgi:hypothetical protein